MLTNQSMKINSYETIQGEISEHLEQKTLKSPGMKMTQKMEQNWWPPHLKSIDGPSNAYRIPREDDSQLKIHRLNPNLPQRKARKRQEQPSHSQRTCPDESGWIHQSKGTNQEKQTLIYYRTQHRQMEGVPRTRSTNGRRADSCGVTPKEDGLETNT